MEQPVGNSTFPESPASTQLVVIGQLRRQLADLMRVESHEVLRPPDLVITFSGQVHGETEKAFDQIQQRFAALGYTAWLRSRPSGHEVLATKGKFERKPGQVRVNVALFLATLLSVLYVGTIYALGYYDIIGPETGLTEVLVTMPLTHLYMGIPFAATLLGILLTHELSHYFVARRYGSPASLPYFIPIPVPDSLGTMGAIIVQRAPMRNRKAVFDIGIAGPLGGLIVAVPLLILGLTLSSVGPPPPGTEIVQQEGNSLLYAALKYLVFRRFLPAGGEDVWLHPVAWAAWAGLLVTMINLIPVGQLDGGHVSYALLGRRAWTLGYVVIVAMIAWGGWLSLNGNGAGGLWLMWGLLNLMLNRQHPPPLDDASGLDLRRITLGLLILLIFIALFMPAPLQIVSVP
jgi:membrane-associated protease RseP (regulator of RpoE activity)